MPKPANGNDADVFPAHVPDIDDFRARFVSDALERTYRNFHMPREVRSSIVTVIIFLVPTLLFAYSDFALFDFSWRFWLLATMRTLLVVYSLLAVFRLSKVSSYVVRDRLVASWLLAMIFVGAYINLTRPTDYYFGSMIDLTMIVLIYLLPQINWHYVVGASLLYSTASLYILTIFKDPLPAMHTLAIYTSYVWINVIGMVGSWQINVYRHESFYALNQARSGQGGGEGNERTAFCVRCMKVRANDGHRESVESYMTKFPDRPLVPKICSDCQSGS